MNRSSLAPETQNFFQIFACINAFVLTVGIRHFRLVFFVKSRGLFRPERFFRAKSHYKLCNISFRD